MKRIGDPNSGGRIFLKKWVDQRNKNETGYIAILKSMINVPHKYKSVARPQRPLAVLPATGRHGGLPGLSVHHPGLECWELPFVVGPAATYRNNEDKMRWERVEQRGGRWRWTWGRRTEGGEA